MNENKIIAKNSIILYFRLLITTVIGLYASRIILLELGIENFGLYSIVGGIVAMMNLMNTSMIATSNRYIAVEIGIKQKDNLNKVFNTLLVIHLFFSILLLIIVEFAGVWYVKNYLNVDVTKISDALFVLHISAISAVIGTVIIPFQGLITAHEKFNVRAAIEIISSILNLGVVLLLVFQTGNKLRTYAMYILIVQLIIAMMYYIYCKYKYSKLIKWKINKNKDDYISISKFFSWQLIYVVGSVGSIQGGAIIINLFFGTLLNAAFGVASKVNEFVFSFVRNMNQAAIPQIMKNYSGGNQERSLNLIYKLSKLTFFIMLIPATPIILSIDSILLFWLKEVPKYTSIFIILRIIHGLICCLESGFDATIDATGKIRKTKMIFSILFLSTLPVVYLLFKLGFPPFTITMIYIGAELLFLWTQTKILSTLTDFKMSKYLVETILPVFLVTIFLIPQYFLHNLFGVGLINIISISLISVFLTLITIFYIGLNNEERLIILSYMYKLPFLKKFS